MSEQWKLWKPLPRGADESRLLRYGLAVLLPILGVILVYTRPVLMDAPYFIFLAFVVISAMFGGLAPAFVTLALSNFLIRFLFIQPYFSIYASGNKSDFERLIWFTFIGLVLASVIAAMRQERNMLRDSEERYRILAESASDAIIVIDEQETIRFVNPVAARIFGINASDLLGKSLSMLLPDNVYGPKLAEIKQNHDTRKKAVTVQLPTRHLSGKDVLLEMTLGTFSRHGKNLFTAIIRDITDHGRLEGAHL